MQQKSLKKVNENPNWENDPKPRRIYVAVKNCKEDFSDKENKIIKKLQWNSC